MGMHLAKLPSGEIVEVWDRPEPAKPTVSTLGVSAPDGCTCECHNHVDPDPLFDSCDDCAADVHIPATFAKGARR